MLHRFYPNVAVVGHSASASANLPVASQSSAPADPAQASPPPSSESVGTVTITSDPDGAEIFVDDKFHGNTPAILKIAAGSHVILLKLPGHADWRRTLEVLKSSRTSLKATLEPDP